MSTYALQTETMLQPTAKNPIHLLGTTTKQDPKTQLPSKRKREALCGLGNFTKSFTIRPCPGSANDKPVLFKPVRVIGRSQLPLTFLDISPDENFAANALFSAHISILEDNDVATEGPEKKARVLVARHETKRMLYAVERVRSRVYSICRLASWIKEKDVGDLWDPSNLQSYPTVPVLGVSEGEGGQWWQHAVVATEPVSPPAKRARLSMMRKPAAPVPTKDDSIPRHDTPAQNPTEHPETTVTGPVDEFTPELPSPQEQLESLVHQYLDAVYLSKTSLAYFAKGPLNRIRNAFTSPDEGAPPTYDLVTALRSMLLSPKASEKKYHEKLPTMIKALPPGTFSDDEAAVKVKKSKKKMKLSRDGVYPQEDMAIRKWWHSDTSLAESSSEETLDQRIKRRIGDLRVRETLTQLILMLEIVALEALSTYKPPPESHAGLDETQIEVDSLEKPKKRKKKLEDITVQLDLLLDRLCIWHATEEAGILDFDRKPTQQFDDAFGSTKRGASDRLRDFCVEVIIPFYMNRLPEQALMVNKKLGGPAHNSPPKRKAMKPPAITRKSGEPKEPETKKSRRSLTRVATERGSKTGDRKTPSLTRSATDSNLLSRIKREGSEVALSAIPFQRSPSKNSRRSISQFRHLEGRELDLTTPSAAVTAKMKQKQRVEEDLKEAISALKKPNRGLAAGGYVDDLERRSLGSANRSRKPMNPVRKVVKDIQVTATPRLGRRTRDIVDVTPDRHYMSNPFARHDETRSIPSGELCIPSSGVRQPAQVVPGTAQRSATGRILAHSSVAETPSKAPNSKSFDSGGARRTIFATPLKPARVVEKSGDATASQLFGSPAQPFHSSPPAPLPQAAVLATPTKVVEAPKTTASSAPKAKPAEEDDIYAALGWNDDDDM